MVLALIICYAIEAGIEESEIEGHVHDRRILREEDSTDEYRYKIMIP